MPIRSYFYNSVSDDRIYDADSWAFLLRSLYSNGVFLATGTELLVSATSPTTLSVQVAVGAGMTDGRYGEVFDAALSLTIAASDPTNPRIDTVVLRRNLDTAVRAAEVVVRAGTPAASPVAPALQRDATIWEEPLADVAVDAGATAIAAANITDRRATASARNALQVAGRTPVTVATAGGIPVLDASGKLPSGMLGIQSAGLDLIQTVTLGAQATSIAFAAIPQTYRHLLLIMAVGLVSDVAYSRQVYVNFNGVTTGYTTKRINSSGSDSTVSAEYLTDGAWANAPTTSSATGLLGTAEMTIPNYTSTTARKNYHGQAFCQPYSTPSDFRLMLLGGYTTATEAVASIQITGYSGSPFTVGSVVSLYGMKN